MTHYHKPGICCGGGVGATVTPSIVNLSTDNTLGMIVASESAPINPLEGMVWRRLNTDDNFIWTEGAWALVLNQDDVDAAVAAAAGTGDSTIDGGVF